MKYLFGFLALMSLQAWAIEPQNVREVSSPTTFDTLETAGTAEACPCPNCSCTTGQFGLKTVNTDDYLGADAGNANPSKRSNSRE